MIKLVNTALILSLIVIALGAYTRLTDAGLGCPDWPGCYGFNTVPETIQDIKIAEAKYPNQPVDSEKAWNEMIHRYIAAILGLVIFTLFIFSIIKKRQPILVTLITILVIFQAILGMLTVTLNLQPIIVMGHLLGGFTILALLALLRLQLTKSYITRAKARKLLKKPNTKPIPIILFMALPVLVIQIALGGWTSANYAAIVCTEWPICNGDWLSQFSLMTIFSLPPQAESYQYGVFDAVTRMNIHITHRIWALVTLSYLLLAAFFIIKRTSSVSVKITATLLIAILTLQVGLGISNVVLQLPLVIAVAHNVVAALLLTTLITLLWLYQQHLQEAS